MQSQTYKIKKYGARGVQPLNDPNRCFSQLNPQSETDFVVMKPSRVLPVALALARDAPLPLDTLYTCGRLGRFSGVFRKGEMMAREESFFLSSLAAAQGSSGSPVLDKNGLLVGMVTDVVPILRESGLFSGDHFAEYVITRCRSFHEAPTTAHPQKQ